MEQNSEYFAGGVNLPLPYATHVAATRWVEIPLHTLMVQPAPDLLIIHLIDCLLQLCLGTNKICSVVASDLSDRPTMSNKLPQSLDK